LPDLLPDDSLLVVQRVEGQTRIESFRAWGPLARRVGIDLALDEQQQKLPISERILRGDFDA
jgi:hypothetical protein